MVANNRFFFFFFFSGNRLANVDEDDHLFGVYGSSGGYADTIFRYAAKVLFGKEIVGPLEFKAIRNSDFREVSLEVSFLRSSFIFTVCIDVCIT